MPEGHTIHRLALDHQQELAGDVLAVSSPQGRHARLAAVLDGHVLESVEAHGKHLFYDWLDAPGLHIHLGLVGRFRQNPSPPPAPSSTVQLRLAGPRATVDLIGATTCELIDQSGRELILGRLGPDLLAAEDNPEPAWTRLSGRSVPMAAALLDQRNLSGVGNVYRSEALFLNGIHPERPASSLSRDEFDRLWGTLRTMLRQGVEDRRIVTVHPSERASVGDGVVEVGPEDSFYVYKQQHCRRCGTPIRVWPVAGRRVYACEHCQPPPGSA
ncbi:MAG: Fpg/Nei family DNA glycosylase [Chloroflexi bacterium]|nr:Fpg/Nei family DNA glycosylase [Chloroflexota bacterium]